MDHERYDRFKDNYGEDYRATLSAANNLAVDLRLIGDWSRRVTSMRKR